MTDRERTTYGLLVGAATLTTLLAAVMTYLASCNDAAWEHLTALMAAVPVIPARYWAKGSDFPDLTAIYFFWSWPVFPTSLAAFATRFWTADDEGYGGRRPADLGTKMVFGSFFMLAFGPVALWAMDGEEVLGVAIGQSLPNLLVFGWIPFAIGGCLTGVGVIGLRRILSPRAAKRNY